MSSVETKLEMFRDIVKEFTSDVCGMRRVGGQRRKRSEWWSDKVSVVEKEMRRAFEEQLQRRERVTYDRYWAHRAVVKQTVKVAKRMTQVKRVRKG